MTTTAELTTNSTTEPITVADPTIRTTWRIDAAHSHVEFAVRHMMIATVRGRFADVEGTIVTTGDDLSTAGIEVRIPAASIDTRQAQRDTHLRSGDFFDVERWPELRFVSTKVERSGDGWHITGDLTIRDSTREVVLIATEGGRTSMYGAERIGFQATGRINRADFGLTWNQALETGGVLVSDEVKIGVDVQIVRDA